ncbi:copia protein, partial [Dentipellis sp. KUC8613]
MQYAVWVWNRTGSRSLPGAAPIERATGVVPDLTNLHEWGCRVWVRVEDRRKLEPQADEGRFVGYSSASKG